jgi:hypothetical protein
LASTENKRRLQRENPKTSRVKKLKDFLLPFYDCLGFRHFVPNIFYSQQFHCHVSLTYFGTLVQNDH